MSRDNEQCLWTLCMMFDPVQNTERRDDRAAAARGWTSSRDRRIDRGRRSAGAAGGVGGVVEGHDRS